MTKKKQKQLVRISSILQRVQNRLLSDDELTRIENLIDIDYCNESILRTIGSEFQTVTDGHFEQLWIGGLQQ